MIIYNLLLLRSKIGREIYHMIYEHDFSQPLYLKYSIIEMKYLYDRLNLLVLSNCMI